MEINERYIYAVLRHLPLSRRADIEKEPRHLPPVPRKKDRIPPSDPIASIIFTVIGMVLVPYVPRFLGFYIGGLTGERVLLFNEAVFRSYLPFILGVMALSLFYEIGRLIAGRWTIPLAVYHLAVNAAGVLLTIIMFTNSGLLNPAFFSRGLELIHTADPLVFGLPLPQLLPRAVIALSVFGFAVEIVVTTIRMISRAVAE